MMASTSQANMPVAVSSSQNVPNHSIRIAIDRGGTFTDVFARVPIGRLSK